MQKTQHLSSYDSNMFLAAREKRKRSRKENYNSPQTPVIPEAIRIQIILRAGKAPILVRAVCGDGAGKRALVEVQETQKRNKKNTFICNRHNSK